MKDYTKSVEINLHREEELRDEVEGWEHHRNQRGWSTEDEKDYKRSMLHPPVARLRRTISYLFMKVALRRVTSFRRRAPRTSSRSRRSPVRSAAKSGGDDGGGDGDSDQGEPPRPSHKGRIILPAPIQARQFLLTHKPNSLSLSRTPHPCYWCMERRWAA